MIETIWSAMIANWLLGGQVAFIVLGGVLAYLVAREQQINKWFDPDEAVGTSVLVFLLVLIWPVAVVVLIHLLPVIVTYYISFALIKRRRKKESDKKREKAA